MYQYKSYQNEFLVHYGVKGMKWGVRRYQNDDGSLTALGKTRYEYKEAKRSRKNSPKDADKEVEYNYRKREYYDQKIREKLSRQTKKSQHQLNLEQRYKDRGLSDDEAAIQAYKRVRTEKILATVGVASVAAVSAYAAYKHYDDVTDRILLKDFKLGRISDNDSMGVKDAFYAYHGERDERLYSGFMGFTVRNFRGKGKNTVYKKNMSVMDTGIKVASRESAKKVLSDLTKSDKNYREKLISYLGDQYGAKAVVNNKKQESLINRAYKDLKSGKGVTNNVYDAVNVILADHTKESSSISSKFYNSLKNQGYSAIRDMNDFKYSGFNAKDPLIIFDPSKVKVDNIIAMGLQEVYDARSVAITDTNTRALGKLTTQRLAPVIGALGVVKKSYSTSSENKFVEDYRREHPNSNLSRNEILKLKDSEK